MAQITTSVHFQVPDENIGRFLPARQKAREKMVEQPGIVSGAFRFINVARWESAGALASGLRATAEALERDGVLLPETFRELDVKVTQNHYVVEADYTA